MHTIYGISEFIYGIDGMYGISDFMLCLIVGIIKNEQVVKNQNIVEEMVCHTTSLLFQSISKEQRHSTILNSSQ